MKQKNNSHLYKPGQSGNPAGRPAGSRNKLVEDFIGDVQTVWRSDGERILSHLAKKKPAVIVDAIVRLAPKDVALTLQQHGGLDADQWAIVARIAGVVREIAPQATPDEIEQVLRAGFAVPVANAVAAPKVGNSNS